MHGNTVSLNYYYWTSSRWYLVPEEAVSKCRRPRRTNRVGMLLSLFVSFWHFFFLIKVFLLGRLECFPTGLEPYHDLRDMMSFHEIFRQSLD